MQTETRILTVPQGQVKGELQVRQAFGWNLAQTSARSFATGASVLGGATEIGGGTYLAGGQVLVRNAHLTDLTLQRHASPRSQRLAHLEHQYDSIQFKPNASGWIIVIVAGLVFGIGLFGGAALVAALGHGGDGVSPMLFLGPAIVGVILGVLVRNWVQRGRAKAHEAAERRQESLLHEARSIA